jgi:hypothetical protein
MIIWLALIPTPNHLAVILRGSDKPLAPHNIYGDYQAFPPLIVQEKGIIPPRPMPYVNKCLPRQHGKVGMYAINPFSHFRATTAHN